MNRLDDILVRCLGSVFSDHCYSSDVPVSEAQLREYKLSQMAAMRNLSFEEIAERNRNAMICQDEHRYSLYEDQGIPRSRKPQKREVKVLKNNVLGL